MYTSEYDKTFTKLLGSLEPEYMKAQSYSLGAALAVRQASWELCPSPEKYFL